MKLILLFLTTLTILLSFDTKTHVFISQEIIKDLEDDGKLTIKPFGSFAPPNEIKNAILNHKSTYKMGSIGPDGFPDIASGQVTVHGGLEDGFKSDDWLKWVISHAKSEQELAFAYGYLAHASSDTFAHTYVNMYTGDVFDAGSEHEDVELRHIYLETFIANFLPPMTDSTGKFIGKPHEVVAVSEELPIDYILNTLLLNDTVTDDGVTHLKSSSVTSNKGFTSTALSEIDSNAQIRAWMIVEDNKTKSTMLTMPTIKNGKSIKYNTLKDNSIEIKIIADVPENGISF